MTQGLESEADYYYGKIKPLFEQQEEWKLDELLAQVKLDCATNAFKRAIWSLIYEGIIEHSPNLGYRRTKSND